MSFNFVFDHCIHNIPYPNLAPKMNNFHNSLHGLGDEYPFISPCRLLLYCRDHGYNFNISYINETIPKNAWYPVGISFFHYEVDYFSMMSPTVRGLLQTDKLKVLFYYHEGDNPYFEKNRLDQLCQQHNLPLNCYKFISGNTKADEIPNFIWFPDHELFYWRNSVKWNDQSMPGVSYHNRIRKRRYTALNRSHKWWRATVMTELINRNLLTNSFWSYNRVDVGDQWKDNPIQLELFWKLTEDVKKFVNQGSVHCDELDSDQQNSHWNLVPKYFDEAYCHIVLETLYDAEQSHGAFLTEKTFKPIRHAQPFIIFGTANSLNTLKQLGYMTFDDILDNSYDEELDNTKRFMKTLNCIENLNKTDLHNFYLNCRNQIIHNQELFLSSKYVRLETLEKKLNND